MTAQTTADKWIAQNQEWAQNAAADAPTMFPTLAGGQSPEVFVIGCCDSRVPVEVVFGAKPGDIFTFRNIANQANLEDDAFLCALDYAVNSLKIDKVIVLGHTHCGGIAASFSAELPQHFQRYVQPIQALSSAHKADIDQLSDPVDKTNYLVNANIRNQVQRIANSDVVEHAKTSGRPISVTGCLYHLESGTVEILT